MQPRCVWLGFLPLVLATIGAFGADSIRIGTYNVENYILESTASRQAKTEASKAKVAESIKALAADVLGLQELGGPAAMEDLRQRLKRVGSEYPHAVQVRGADTNIQLALFSRFPIVASRGYTNDSFLLSGQRFRVSRGFLEADIEPVPGQRVVVMVAHLKSRRTSVRADESDIRREEARLLREHIEARLKAEPSARVVVVGDLNDSKDSEAIRLLLGRGRTHLVDSRPSERNGDTGFSPNPRWQPRTVAWTHYYGVEDSYARLDYILLSERAAAEWLPAESGIPLIADWGLASDHRPIAVVLRLGSARP